jgi:hypothetical protein
VYFFSFLSFLFTRLYLSIQRYYSSYYSISIKEKSLFQIIFLPMMNIETLLQAAQILESQQSVPPKKRLARGEYDSFCLVSS